MLLNSILEAISKADIPKIKTQRYKLKGLGKTARRKKKKRIKKEQEQYRKYKNRVPKQYKVYIKSHWWDKRRAEFFKRYGRKCALCRSSKFVQLHHSFYGEYGFEKDEHLVPLCQPHHFLFHKEIGKVKKDMTKETLKFLADHYDPFKG